MNNKQVFFLGAVVGFFITVSFFSFSHWLSNIYNHPELRIVDQRTKDLCRYYANLDHEKELAPDRWKAYGDEFKRFDWYTSCVHHVQYPFQP